MKVDFFARWVRILRVPPLRILLEDMYYLGVLSLPVMLLVAGFAGMTSAIEFYNTFNKIGGTYTVGIFITYAALRELGPLLAAAVVAGKGAAMLTSMIAYMKYSGQIKALESMGINPLFYVVSPAIWAGIIITPLMVIISDFTIITSSLITYVWQLHGSIGTFYKNFVDYSDFKDLIYGLMKGGVFGFLLGIISSIAGLRSKGSQEGIGNATRIAVVYIIIAVLVTDVVLSLIFYGSMYIR